MKVSMLIKLNPVDELRFYENYQDLSEDSPYKTSDEINHNREIKCFFISTEECCGEVEAEWISVILKEEENAEV